MNLIISFNTKYKISSDIIDLLPGTNIISLYYDQNETRNGCSSSLQVIFLNKILMLLLEQ